jgi:hypothetical protein
MNNLKMNIILEDKNYYILKLFYGPVKPHFGQRYDLPNCLHFAQRQMRISPQLGQLVLVESSPGGIILLHDIHLGIIMFTFSLIATP